MRMSQMSLKTRSRLSSHCMAAPEPGAGGGVLGRRSSGAKTWPRTGGASAGRHGASGSGATVCPRWTE